MRNRGEIANRTRTRRDHYLKGVFRDLLSSNHKALTSPPGQPNRESYRSFEYRRSDSSNTEQKTPKFKGLLSIGVNEDSNSLVISAPAYLFEQVVKLVDEIDQATDANYTVRILRPANGISAARLKEAIDAAQGKAVTTDAAQGSAKTIEAPPGRNKEKSGKSPTNSSRK
jgi:type II secretory pathway component GspD/PulD (secretin)